MTATSLLRIGDIAHCIHWIRGTRVMLDGDLAHFYGVTTARLNEQVRRNAGRFPQDFMFQLTLSEHRNLMSQIATSRSGWGGRRKTPSVFTEHGALMLASVLNTPIAVTASVRVVRAFVRLRTMVAHQRRLASKLAEIERKLTGHDARIDALFDAIRELMDPPEPPSREIGFHVKERAACYRTERVR